MALTLSTAPTVEPVSLDEAKGQVRVELDFHSDDALILGLIAAARRLAEVFCGRAFLTQTWDLTLDAFPSGWGARWPATLGGRDAIRLPRPPLQSVSYVKYVDTAGVLQTLAPSAYLVGTAAEPGRILPAYGTFWPPTRPQIEAVSIRYVAGWASAALVPPTIKQAILLLVGLYYENREAATLANFAAVTLPFAVESLLWAERIPEAA